MPIRPFISPTELKERIDAGQNWVPLSMDEIKYDMYSSNYQDFGYASIQIVGWTQGKELSPIELGLPMGPARLYCMPILETRTDKDGNNQNTLRFEPIDNLISWYGLLTEDCERYVKKAAPVEVVGKACEPTACNADNKPV